MPVKGNMKGEDTQGQGINNPDTEVLMKIAEIEASLTKGQPSNKKMTENLDVTIYQIKAKRNKPI